MMLVVCIHREAIFKPIVGGSQSIKKTGMRFGVIKFLKIKS